MTQLSCHVLDTASGMPAVGIDVELYYLDNHTCLATETTNKDGRAKFENIHLDYQAYTLRFLVKPYCEKQFGQAFFPVVDVHFCVSDTRKYHIPLLLSPFSYSSYRGS